MIDNVILDRTVNRFHTTRQNMSHSVGYSATLYVQSRIQYFNSVYQIPLNENDAYIGTENTNGKKSIVSFKTIISIKSKIVNGYLPTEFDRKPKQYKNNMDMEEERKKTRTWEKTKRRTKNTDS